MIPCNFKLISFCVKMYNKLHEEYIQGKILILTLGLFYFKSFRSSLQFNLLLVTLHIVVFSSNHVNTERRTKVISCS